MDQDSVKLGLLMETAERHQLAAAVIRELDEQTQGLQAMVSDQVRGALTEEIRIVHTEAQKAVESLQRVKRAANARLIIWTLALTVSSARIALFVTWWVLPTPEDIARIRSARAELTSNLALLNRHGARGHLRHCGTARLYVRVDLNAPRYGGQRDYFVIRGDWQW